MFELTPISYIHVHTFNLECELVQVNDYKWFLWGDYFSIFHLFVLVALLKNPNDKRISKFATTNFTCCPFKISKWQTDIQVCNHSSNYLKYLMNNSKEHSLLVRMKKSMAYGDWNNVDIVELNVFEYIFIHA